MEALLQALHYEPDSGGFFRRYIEKSANQVGPHVFFIGYVVGIYTTS